MISTKHNKLMALMAGSMLLYSCSNEEINTENADNRMMINISAPASRATVDNSWDEGNVIAVKYGNKVRQYTVGSDLSSLVTSEEPFEWAESEQSIEAWFTGDNTYNATLPTSFSVAENQNTEKEYEKSDFLYSPAQSIFKTPDNKVSLSFYHQIAKLVVNIKKEKGVTDAIGELAIGNNNISVTGTYTAPTEGNYGTWTVDKVNQSASITPKALTAAAENYEKSYAALIIPQTVAGTLFKVGDLPYTLSSNQTFESGKKYTYNITITANGEINVTLEENGEWNAGEPVQISYLGDTNDPTKVNVGDLILSDGSFIYKANAASMTDKQKKACRAVIFRKSHLKPWDTSDYTNTGIGQKECHGYAVALYQARPSSSNQGVCKWSTNTIALNLKTWYAPDKRNMSHTEDFGGYKYTQMILSHVKKYSITMNAEVFGATFWTTVDYEKKHPAPNNTSGWFLPSSGQMRDVILKYKNFNGNFDGGLFYGLPNGLVENLLGPYWTSSEYENNDQAIATIVIGKQNEDKDFVAARKHLQSDNGQSNLKVRSILAF